MTARARAIPVQPKAVYQPLVTVLLAVAVGVVVDRHFAQPLVVWLVSAASLWLAWWLLWQRGARASALALLGAVLATAGAWLHCQWSLFAIDEVGLYARDTPAPACLEAIAVTAPRRVPAPPPDAMQAYQIGERSRLEIRVVAIRDAAAWASATGETTLIVDGQLLGISAGDRLRLCGQIGTPHGPENPGEFDFATHARTDRHMATVRCDAPECVRKLASGSIWNVGGWIDSVQRHGDELLHRYLAPERSGLAAAMFLGLREGLQTDESQAFMETGTIHLLVISGLNMAILARCLYLLLRAGVVPASWKLIAVGLVTLDYAVLTDSQPPVVRATIMVIVVCAAKLFGRRALDFNTLAAAALLVLAINPGELFRAGTQLSFLSVAATICVAQFIRRPRVVDPLDRLIAESRTWPWHVAIWVRSWFWEIVVVSVVVWLVVAPLVMARFHLVSPVAIFLGPVLAIPVAIAMAAGFGVLLLGWLVPPLGAACGWLCDVNLQFLQFAVGRGRVLPLSQQWVAGPGGVLGSDNANSIVLDIEYQGRRVLLTGDLETPGLDDLLAEAPLDADVLLAPHHGSAFSDPPGIAQWSTPEFVVISGSQRDDRPEVRSAYLARGSQVLHTADVGAVEMRVERGELRIDAWHKPR